ncbi:AzlC family protein [Neisseria meningitidis]|nr:AzlC family protein [Neisseria meningitidis]
MLKIIAFSVYENYRIFRIFLQQDAENKFALKYSGLTKTSTALPRLSSKRTIL